MCFRASRVVASFPERFGRIYLAADFRSEKLGRLGMGVRMNRNLAKFGEELSLNLCRLRVSLNNVSGLFADTPTTNEPNSPAG